MDMSKVGAFPNNSKEEKISEHKIDLGSLTHPQLAELLERQVKIIRSPIYHKLPDKGAKVKLRIKEIEEELQKRSKVEDISEELMKLSIHEKKVELIEWGEKDVSHVSHFNNENHSLGDENETLAMLVTHSGTAENHLKIRVEEPEESLITPNDIADAYAISLCNKIDKAASKQKFLPHKTLNKSQPITKLRDLSAAASPVPVFNDVKLISLEESLKLQVEQTQLLKETQLKHATERLKDIHHFKTGLDLPDEDSSRTYREPNVVFREDDSDSDNEKDE